MQVAEFGAPHGLKGEVRLKVLTEEPETLLECGPLTGQDGRAFTLTDLRPARNVMIARVKGVRYRDEAEGFNRVKLYLDRSALPAPQEDEFATLDLIGCAVVDEAGERLGRIRSVPDFGAGDLLEIEGLSGSGGGAGGKSGGGGTWFLDFTLANVPDIDLAARRVTVRVPGDVSEREADGEEAGDETGDEAGERGGERGGDGALEP